MSELAEAKCDVDAGSAEEKKITKEEFAKSLCRSLRQFAPILLGVVSAQQLAFLRKFPQNYTLFLQK